MANNEYKAIKKIMNNKELADEMEKIHPGLKSQMSGYLCSPWLPAGATRKIIMLVIALVAFYAGYFYGNKFYLIFLILPTFSPRFVGELLNFLGKFSKPE